MYLVIAEKPSVAANIAKVLGAYKRQDGYLEGGDCIVSWCLGHLVEYESPEAYDERYSKWNYEDLPIIPDEWKLTISADKKDQFKVVKALLNRSNLDYVVNACDAGREGESIFRLVYDMAGSRLPMKRLWISSMEDSAIRDGFNHLKDGSYYDNLAESARCRAQADWLVGMNATRAYTTKYYKKLTVGRVQTPTLAMLVAREQAIRGFQKEKYFNVELNCGGMKAEKQKIFDREEAEQLQRTCQGSDAVISDVRAMDKVRKTPKLYDLTTLQRDANRCYGLTAQQTLNAAQSLYEQKLITYPRTDSQYLTEDMEETAAKVIRCIHDRYHPLGTSLKPFRPDIRRVMNNKKVSDHHAIIPTVELAGADLSNLSQAEAWILELTAIRLLEATGEDHRYTETVVTITCQGAEFLVRGKQIQQIGWLIYEDYLKKRGAAEEEKNPEEGNDPNACGTLPPLSIGLVYPGVAASLSEHFTAPPKPYSEDTLLAAMETAGNKEFNEDTEKKGLGTPATRAGIIEKLVHTQYAVRKGKQILPTEDGKVLVEILPDFLKSASMTAGWENQLLQIERGELEPQKFMTGIKNMLTMMLNGCDILSEEETSRFHNQKKESIGTCPLCGSLVYEGGKNFYCSSHDCHFVLWKENRYLERMKKHIDAQMAAQLLKSGRTHAKNFYSAKKNAYFEADLLMEVQPDGRVQFSMEFPKNSSGKSGRKNTR